MPTLPVHVGTHLRAAREKAGYTQGAAAQAIGVTAAPLHLWENGGSTPPIRKAFALADLYNTTLDELLGYPVPDPTEGA